MNSLKPCPSTPNCLCSKFPDDRSHYLAPISVQGKSSGEIFDRIVKVGSTFEKVDEIQRTENYLQLTFKSRLLRFTDDVEFLLEGNLLHFRSASRIGYYDFQANKKRIEKIRESLL